jgi:hypothetical protein
VDSEDSISLTRIPESVVPEANMAFSARVWIRLRKFVTDEFDSPRLY